MHQIHVHAIFTLHILPNKLNLRNGCFLKVLQILLCAWWNYSLISDRWHLWTRKKDDSKVIGYSTVKQHRTACIDLYKRQKSLNMSANLHPQDCPALNVLFNAVKSDENKKHQVNFEGRGIGTIQDGYSSTEELSRITNYSQCGNPSSSSCFWAMFLLKNFIWWGECLCKDWSWQISSSWILIMKFQLNVREL